MINSMRRLQRHHLRYVPTHIAGSLPADLANQQQQKKILIRIIDPLIQGDDHHEPSMVLQAAPGDDLRSLLLRNKANMYQDDWTQHSRSCGGGGSCFTCLIELLDEAGVVSKRSEAEEQRLRGRPETWRLSCQCLVEDTLGHAGCTVKLGPRS